MINPTIHDVTHFKCGKCDIIIPRYHIYFSKDNFGTLTKVSQYYYAEDDIRCIKCNTRLEIICMHCQSTLISSAKVFQFGEYYSLMDMHMKYCHGFTCRPFTNDVLMLNFTSLFSAISHAVRCGASTVLLNDKYSMCEQYINTLIDNYSIRNARTILVYMFKELFRLKMINCTNAKKYLRDMKGFVVKK